MIGDPEREADIAAGIKVLQERIHDTLDLADCNQTRRANTSAFFSGGKRSRPGTQRVRQGRRRHKGCYPAPPHDALWPQR